MAIANLAQASKFLFELNSHAPRQPSPVCGIGCYSSPATVVLNRIGSGVNDSRGPLTYGELAGSIGSTCITCKSEIVTKWS